MYASLLLNTINLSNQNICAIILYKNQLSLVRRILSLLQGRGCYIIEINYLHLLIPLLIAIALPLAPHIHWLCHHTIG